MSENGSTQRRKKLVGAIAAALAVAVLVVAGFVSSQTSSAIPAINVDSEQLAIHGYDTVAYFTDNKAMQGSKEHSADWEDATWHFASAGNRDLFEANPERYAQQFGGYCALGLAAGEFADIDPKAFTIVDGKLYFNKTKQFREAWRKAPDAYLVTANYNWSENRKNLRDNR